MSDVSAEAIASSIAASPDANAIFDVFAELIASVANDVEVGHGRIDIAITLSEATASANKKHDGSKT